MGAIFQIGLFVISGCVIGVTFLLTRRFKPSVQWAVRGVISGLVLMPAIISTHGSYLVPAWWLLLIAQAPPRGWSVTISLLFSILIFVIGMSTKSRSP